MTLYFHSLHSSNMIVTVQLNYKASPQLQTACSLLRTVRVLPSYLAVLLEWVYVEYRGKCIINTWIAFPGHRFEIIFISTPTG